MKKKLSIMFALVLVASLCLVPAVASAESVGLAGGVYDSTLILENKEGFGATGAWTIKSDDIGGTLGYNASGPEFVWGLEAKVLTSGTYALIYYADMPNRFVDWGGDNPGKHIATVTANSEGVISASGSKELNMDLPCPPDANQFEIDYSEEYNTAHGAKIWLVPTSDYTAPALIAWNPESYLFETDLIWYDDTEVESNVLAITVNPTNINFGILTPGMIGVGGDVTVANDGNVPITVTTLDMATDNVFKFLKLGGDWADNYTKELPVTENDLVAVTLHVPGSYDQTGAETGTLTFIATSQ